MSQFIGKYRGKVVNNVDPMNMGRVMVQVPDVGQGNTSTWAMPASQCAGSQSGLFGTPVVGSNVWVEFEQGNSDYPIIAGGFWGDTSELPGAAASAPPGVQCLVLQSSGQNSLVISDAPGGGITLQSASGASISITATGITITNGQASIVISGPTVNINDGALVVT